MSSPRIVIASTGSAGIQSIWRMTFTLAQATPNQRPQVAPRQIAKRGEELQNAEAEQEPAPSAEIAEHVTRVRDEEAGRADRGDPVQRVE